jgi:hypothetical protein
MFLASWIVSKESALYAYFPAWVFRRGQAVAPDNTRTPDAHRQPGPGEGIVPTVPRSGLPRRLSIEATVSV